MRTEALWNVRRVTRDITEGAIHDCLEEASRAELAAVEDIERKAAGALENPKPLDINMPVLNAVLAAQYYELFEALEPPRAMSVYEPCVGASRPVILAAEAYTRGEGSYLSINLNKKLRDELESKIAHVRMKVRIVQDHAQTALEHVAAGSVDVACFHHAVNDILQTAASEPRGMDTTAVDWFPNERQMIEWLDEDVKAGRMEERAKPALMQIVGDAVRLVRPGGYLVFDHFNWCRFIGVDWFPWDLFYGLIPMTREWVVGSGMPVEEVRIAGMDPQWWMVLRRG